jgi:hypothetical protein
LESAGDGIDAPMINPYPLDQCAADIGYHSTPHVGCILR